MRKHTLRKRELDPTGYKTTVEVSMGNDDDVAGTLPLFFPPFMIFANLRHRINNRRLKRVDSLHRL